MYPSFRIFPKSRSHALRGNAVFDALRRVQELRQACFMAVQDAEHGNQKKPVKKVLGGSKLHPGWQYHGVDNDERMLQILELAK